MLIAADSMKAVNAFKATITAAFDAHDLGRGRSLPGHGDHSRPEGPHASSWIRRPCDGAAGLQVRLGRRQAAADGDSLSKSIELSNGADHVARRLDKDVYTYTNLVSGACLYMSVCTRPDIAQAVGALSKFMAAPTTTHWQAATGVLASIWRAARASASGLWSERRDRIAGGYTDADYAGDAGGRGAPACGLYVFKWVFGGAVSWSSKRQGERVVT